MSLWAALFIEFWKRQTFKLTYDWDLTDIDEDGQLRPNPVTLRQEKYINRNDRMRKKIVSALVVLTCICIVIATLFLSIFLRTYFKVEFSTSAWFVDLKNSNETVASIVSPALIASILSSCLSVVIIIILQQVYNIIARKLTDWECHRTELHHENAFIHKMFWFQFFNFYSPLFYIAFFKGGLDRYPGNYFYLFGYRWQGCDGGQCTYELAIQLFIILIVKQFLFGVIELIIPKVAIFFKKRQIEKSKEEKDLNRWEQDYILTPITDLTLFDEYLEMVIQYGFVTLFVVSFPLAPIFALINNMIELRLDALKFMAYRQRVVSKRAANIGAWEDYIALLSKIAVISNALVIAMTMETIPKMVYGWTHDSLDGYVENSLSSYNTSCFYNKDRLNLTQNGVQQTSCSYYGHREVVPVPNGDQNCHYQNNVEFFLVLVARLVFVLIIEHAVFVAVIAVDYLIPDRSPKLEAAVKREHHITRTIMSRIEIIAKFTETLKGGANFATRPNRTSIVSGGKRYSINKIMATSKKSN